MVIEACKSRGALKTRSTKVRTPFLSNAPRRSLRPHSSRQQQPLLAAHKFKLRDSGCGGATPPHNWMRATSVSPQSRCLRQHTAEYDLTPGMASDFEAGSNWGHGHTGAVVVSALRAAIILRQRGLS